jgi:uncharacterized membrane protein
MQHIRRYFFAGLLVWIPIIVTLVVLRFLVELLDSGFSLLPKSYHPIPGFGFFLSLVIVFFTGMLATNFIGSRLVAFGEAIVGRIPIVRSIYMAVKQVMETIFSSSGQSFRKVYLVEYPRKGIWSIGFQTGTSTKEVEEYVMPDMLTLFIPTTPNPTSGFMFMVPRGEAYELQMSVEQALKLVISLGVVQPDMNLRDKNTSQGK